MKHAPQLFTIKEASKRLGIQYRPLLEAVISNYDSASKKLDEIVFLSDVTEIDASTFKLSYLDRIRKGSVWHEHRCEQIIRFEKGKIVEIKHLDLPGEAETLKKFYKAVGLS